MIQIGDKIVSRDLFEKHFSCHLEECRGSCCIIGDSGAPLEDAEAKQITEYLSLIKTHMKREGIEAVDEQGGWVVDGDGDQVTPLVAGEECAYVVFEEGIARCAVEHAYKSGSIPFQKPLSCHLYPIRINKLRNSIALNYHRWDICEPARMLGKQEGIPVFRFLKDALIRAFGDAFFEEMETVYAQIIDDSGAKTVHHNTNQ